MRVTTLAAVTLLSVTAGCIGYRPSGGECESGYSETALGEGSYGIRIAAPGPSSRATLVSALNRRAGELCPAGFALTDVATHTGACMHRSPVEFSYATALATCTR